jgi:hypothetical protein
MRVEVPISTIELPNDSKYIGFFCMTSGTGTSLLRLNFGRTKQQINTMAPTRRQPRDRPTPSPALSDDEEVEVCDDEVNEVEEFEPVLIDGACVDMETTTLLLDEVLVDTTLRRYSASVYMAGSLAVKV